MGLGLGCVFIAGLGHCHNKDTTQLLLVLLFPLMLLFCCPYMIVDEFLDAETRMPIPADPKPRRYRP